MAFKMSVEELNMYAVIGSGGKQHRVQVGDILHLEKLPQDQGQIVNFTQVLAVSGEKGLVVGQPFVEKAEVKGLVLKQRKKPKILVLKKKRRKGYRRFKGHRQFCTDLRIEYIKAPCGETVQIPQKTKQSKKKSTTSVKKSSAQSANKKTAKTISQKQKQDLNLKSTQPKPVKNKEV